MKNFAHLKPESPFHVVFENGMAPIRNFLFPCVGEMEGAGVHEFYWLDVEKCTGAQIDQIARLVAINCGGLPIEVEEHMRAEGVLPLRALHVSGVSTYSLWAFL
jgi:hypothetical protein